LDGVAAGYPVDVTAAGRGHRRPPHGVFSPARDGSASEYKDLPGREAGDGPREPRCMCPEQGEPGPEGAGVSSDAGSQRFRPRSVQTDSGLYRRPRFICTDTSDLASPPSGEARPVILSRPFPGRWAFPSYSVIIGRPIRSSKPSCRVVASNRRIQSCSE
jgi:hypothetical protein